MFVSTKESDLIPPIGDHDPLVRSALGCQTHKATIIIPDDIEAPLSLHAVQQWPLCEMAERVKGYERPQLWLIS